MDVAGGGGGEKRNMTIPKAKNGPGKQSQIRGKIDRNGKWETPGDKEPSDSASPPPGMEIAPSGTGLIKKTVKIRD